MHSDLKRAFVSNFLRFAKLVKPVISSPIRQVLQMLKS
ncbi:hypothetical protein LSAJ156_350001 [Latilactobacillus sakei]|nr:hypothetical protein LSAJ160_190001 [Latilactobacillus sakei]SOB39434.1 hypothetical protein LSAJ156_350001 [Latilactobacillus sakei]